jgi:hypothetical protein
MVTPSVLMNTVLRCASFAYRVFPCALLTESYDIAQFIVSNVGLSGDSETVKISKEVVLD